MQTKAPGLINYLEKISFQTIGLNLQYDLTGFDYGQAKQTLIFYGNLIDTSLKNPFLGGRVVFNSNQGGTVISFTHDILDMRLSTVPGFITGGEVGMWNSKFYIKISFNELLYQRYLDVKGVETTFKMSVELDGVVYSFSEVNNENIQQQKYMIFDCWKQILKLKEACQKLALGQQYGKIIFDIISLKNDDTIASMFKVCVQESQTCWNRAFATRQGNQFKIDLYNNHNCDIKQGQLKLFNANNDLVLEEAFVNKSYQHVYHGDFESELYTMVLESNGEQYSIVIDKIKHIKADYATILAVTVGSCFIIYCMFLLVTRITEIIRNKNRIKQKQNRKIRY